MKYWNKDKEIRKRLWTKVPRPRMSVMWQLVSGNEDVPSIELKQWCQQQASPGRFYYYYGADSWWFEHGTDAIHFSLRWA